MENKSPLANTHDTNLALTALLVFSLSGTTHAFTFSNGNVDGAFDTTFTAGAQWRIESRDPQLVSQANGGANGVSLTDLSDGGTGDGSSNTDDGNLNYGSGLISSPVKGTHELSLFFKNIGLFVRGTYFFDPENVSEKTDRRAETVSTASNPRLAGLYGGLGLLAQNNLIDLTRIPSGTTLAAGEQYSLSKDAKEAVGKDAQLLDAFISASWDFGEHPLDVRFGRQVVSWGESTFIQNGINVINPVDVPAIRLPGAELKEALLPISMLWTAFGLSQNLTLEAFYQLDWQETQVDEPGTYFATNDFVGDGGRFVTISGLDECADRALACIYPNSVSRATTQEADDSGQYGLALRWFAEHLNNTEFGLYALNYHSRRPIISAIAGSYDDAAFINSLLTNAGFFIDQGFSLADIVAPSLIAAQHNTLEAGTGQYFLEYPEDIRLFGLSFNSSIDGLGIALGGEFSIRPDAPIQLDDQELLQAALSSSDDLVVAAVQQAVQLGVIGATEAAGASAGGLQGPNSQYNQVFGDVGQGDRITGYIEKEVIQAQMTAIKLFGPTLGASQWALVGEVGFTHINLPEKNILLTDAPGAPDDGQRTTQSGFGDDFSWGYRLRARFDYNNLFSGWNMTNTYSFAHDVNGNTPLPIANFLEDRKAFEFSMGFDRQNTYGIGVTYATFWGAGERNLISDRDFAALTFRYSL
jgi:hypothetical protein